ncbi:MAG TPA: DHA2 family efflux MFS transporter permease subunit [Gammaproteobacteria bacterium]
MEHKHRVFLVCVIGIFVTVFDTSSSIVALPTIALELGTDLPTAQWVIIGNGLTIAALLVPVGRLSDLIGRKRIYVVGAVAFALGALAASRAGSIYELIAARVLVGVGSAMTQGTGMAILVGQFAPHERGRMLGMQLGVVGLGAIVGPAGGGLIVGAVGWRALFAVTVVAMLAIAVTAVRVLRRRAERPPADRPFDYLGALLFSGFLVALLLTLTLGPRAGWGEARTLAGLAASLVLLAAFIAVERRHASPMVDLGLFRNGAFGLGSLSAVVTFMGISSTRFLAPFFLQGVKGLAPAQVGLLIVPAALVTALTAPFAGRMADRFGVRLLANIGMGICLVGFGLFGLLETTTPVWAVVAGLMVMSLGMSAFGAANSASMLNSLDADAHGVGSGFVNLCRNSGNVIGIAFGTAVVTLTMGAAGYPPSLEEVGPGADSGILVAFTRGVELACFALALLALAVLTALVAWSWRRRRAALGRR